jgi:membrane-bound lytic murein transglycosylase D
VVVRVPAGSGPTVARRWSELPAKERITFVMHRVAKGETLSGIAQRYGISTRVLQAANPRVQAHRMGIGLQLTVPVSRAAQRTAAGSAPRAAARAPAAAGSSYIVRPGDSLWTIAQRHGVAVADLKRWNGLSGSLVRVGQALRVRAP